MLMCKAIFPLQALKDGTFLALDSLQSGRGEEGGGRNLCVRSTPLREGDRDFSVVQTYTQLNLYKGVCEDNYHALQNTASF